MKEDNRGQYPYRKETIKGHQKKLGVCRSIKHDMIPAPIAKTQMPHATLFFCLSLSRTDIISDEEST